MLPSRLLRAPVFEDTERTRAAAVLAPLLTVLTASMMVVAICGFFVPWILPGQLAGLFLSVGVFAGARWAVERGHVRGAARACAGLLVLSSMSSLVLDASAAAYPVSAAVTVAVCGLTLGGRAAVGTAVGLATAIGLVHGGQIAGVLQLRRPPETTGVVIVQALCLLVLGAVMLWSHRALLRALATVKRKEAERRTMEAGMFRAQRLEALGRLAGGVAHDFNNLLSTALLNAEELKHARLEPGEWEALHAIELACESATSLTGQLLTLGRQQKLEVHDLDLADVVGAFEPILVTMIGRRGTLELECAPGLGTVAADPHQLQHAVANLVINAAKSLDPGGTVRIQLATEGLDHPIPASHGTIEPGEYCVLRVRDDGQGMDDQTLARAVDPFFTTRESGSGLGLAVVHGVVSQHGGHVDIKSRPGHGTTVAMWFPRRQAAPTWKPRPARHALAGE